MKPLLAGPARILRPTFICTLWVVLLGAVSSLHAATTLTLDLTNLLGNTITVPNNDSLTLLRVLNAGTLTNNGTIALNSVGNFTDLLVSGGTVTLAGTGSVTMSNNVNNRILGPSLTDGLINGPTHTIQGAGQIGLGITNLTNQGLIVANQTNTLTVIPYVSGMINTGTLRAASGGTLFLQGTFNNAGGLIEAQTGSTVRFSDATIVGGTLTSSGTGHLVHANLSNFTDVTLSTGSIFDVNNNTSATMGGTFSNRGTVNLNSAGNSTNLIVATGGLTLSGGGLIVLGNNSNNRIYGNTASGVPTLLNQDNTIRGAGQVGMNALAIDNRATIEANFAGSTLEIDSGGNGVTNTGTLQAVSGGILRIDSSTIANASGTIRADTGSRVDVAVSTITDGTLTTVGTGVIRIVSASTLGGILTVSSGSQVDILNNANLTLLATGLYHNTGTLTLSSVGNSTDLKISGGDVTIDSTGTLTLGNNINNRIYGVANTDRLVNSAGHTIQGSGQIGANFMGLVNHGVVVANQATGLVIDPSAAGVINAGTLRAASGATLKLQDGAFTSTSGIIEATGTGSTVEFSGADVTDGLIRSGAGASLRAVANSSFNNVTLDTGSDFQVANNVDATFVGTLTNLASIVLASVGNSTDFIAGGTGDLTLTGGGTITLGNNINNRIFGSLAANRLINVNNTIQGAGQIGVDFMGFVNQGTVIANQSAGLTIDPSAAGVTNTGTLRAASGATLRLQGGTFTNTNGTIEATGSGSLVEFTSAAVSNGVVRSSAGGTLRNVGASSYTNVTLGAGSDFQIANNTDATFAGTLTNAGTIAFNSAGNSTDFIAGGTGDLTLTGGGTLTLGNNSNNRIFGSVATNRLVNVNNTIQGAGQIGADFMGLLNQSTILANQSTALVIDPSSIGVTNTGLLRANAGATLQLQGGTFTNTGGTIEAFGTGALVILNGAAITGGTLHTANGGLLRNTGASSYTNVLLNGTLEIANNISATFAGTLDNSGVVQLSSVGNATDFIVGAGNLTMNGGAIVMGNNVNNRIYGAANTNIFVNQGGTISGVGQIGADFLKLDNRGTIDANVSGATLTIDPSARGALNTGTFTATNGGILRLAGGTFDNTGGTISPGTGSRVELSAATIQGGTLSGTTIRTVGSSTLSGLNIASGTTVELNNNLTLTLLGAISNSGLIQLQSVGNSTDLIAGAGGATLSGGGVIELTNNANNRIYGVSGSTVLNNVDNTIRGGGQLGANQLTLTNTGTIEANQSTALTVNLADASPFTNQGTLRVASGAQIIFTDNLVNAATVSVHSGGTFTGQGTFTQTGGSTSLVGGTFTATSSSFQSGALQGSGTVNGAVTSGGTLAPGASGTSAGIGLITFNQTLTLTSTSMLQMELGGVSNYDQIQAPAGTLNGSLSVSFINGFQSTIQSSDTFTLLAITGRTGFTGTFSGIADGTRIATADGLGSFQVNYLSSGVSLSQFAPVPEPSTYALLALGGVVFFLVRRRLPRL